MASVIRTWEKYILLPLSQATLMHIGLKIALSIPPWAKVA